MRSTPQPGRRRTHHTVTLTPGPVRKLIAWGEATLGEERLSPLLDIAIRTHLRVMARKARLAGTPATPPTPAPTTPASTPAPHADARTHADPPQTPADTPTMEQIAADMLRRG